MEIWKAQRKIENHWTMKSNLPQRGPIAAKAPTAVLSPFSWHHIRQIQCGTPALQSFFQLRHFQSWEILIARRQKKLQVCSVFEWLANLFSHFCEVRSQQKVQILEKIMWIWATALNLPYLFWNIITITTLYKTVVFCSISAYFVGSIFDPGGFAAPAFVFHRKDNMFGQSGHCNSVSKEMYSSKFSSVAQIYMVFSTMQWRHGLWEVIKKPWNML